MILQPTNGATEITVAQLAPPKLPNVQKVIVLNCSSVAMYVIKPVSAAAKDANLKKLAAATLPVIATHLTVSKQVKAKM